MAMRGIDNDHIDARIDKRLRARQPIGTGADSGGSAQTPFVILALFRYP